MSETPLPPEKWTAPVLYTSGTYDWHRRWRMFRSDGAFIEIDPTEREVTVSGALTATLADVRRVLECLDATPRDTRRGAR